MPEKQMSLFDFLGEMGTEMPRTEYRVGQTFSKPGLSVGIVDGPGLRFTKNGYAMELKTIGADGTSFPETARFMMPAMYFSFYKNGVPMGDSWLADPDILEMLREHWPEEYVRTGNEIFLKPDFRDLFTMKWLGLERLPDRHFERIEGRKPKHATYYDIDISVGELLRFLGVKEEKREWKSTKST